ncbi:response regulator transcription factor [Metabacillus litoralis]|uniref:Response regulator transcription factor n=1 Tax=Metabacillus litoralis TaxID=152268 RepID=A0A5C6VJ86_9BACI|nr:response regulator [Metabacillus litoralis]TXC85652.1 response regulator transcription factor [Metabacillus litoralis]
MITVVIAEDHELVLGTIGSLLDLEDDMKVVGQESSVEGVLTLVNELQPDICLMDLDMFETGIVEKLKPYNSKIMVLTTFAKTGSFQQIINHDVRGYLLKDTPSEELTEAIRSIMNEIRIYSPNLLEENQHDTNSENVNSLISNQNSTDTSKPHNKTLGTVRSYLTTIKDKMKLPTG